MNEEELQHVLDEVEVLIIATLGERLDTIADAITGLANAILIANGQ